MEKTIKIIVEVKSQDGSAISTCHSLTFDEYDQLKDPAVLVNKIQEMRDKANGFKIS